MDGCRNPFKTEIVTCAGKESKQKTSYNMEYFKMFFGWKLTA